MIRLAIVGTGNMANTHANEFNKRYFVIIISALIFIPIYKILFEANRVHEFLYFDF